MDILQPARTGWQNYYVCCIVKKTTKIQKHIRNTWLTTKNNNNFKKDKLKCESPPPAIPSFVLMFI